MNKRKLLTLALTLCMAAILAIGGTLAYFTDTEADTNVFTLGDVIIDLVEEQRNTAGTGLEEFKDDKLLMPIVGSAQGEKVKVGGYNLPTAKNWVDKIVTVDNEGNQPAYVRVLFAFPAKLDDAASAANMIMHWNHDGEMPAGFWTHKDCGVKINIDGADYNVYNYTYEHALAKKGDEGSTTAWPAITGVYMDSRVDATTDDNGNVTYSMKLKDGTVKSATYAKGEKPKLLVLAQGVQEAGFTSADAALTAGFGEVTEGNAQAWFEAATSKDREDVK